MTAKQLSAAVHALYKKTAKRSMTAEEHEVYSFAGSLASIASGWARGESLSINTPNGPLVLQRRN